MGRRKSRKGSRKNNHANKKAVDALKHDASVRRDAHFSNGGSSAGWIRELTTKVHKKQKDKRKTRSSRKKDAIRRSLDGE